MSNPSVDIIVPIYNGYDDVLLCLKSIQKHTNLQQNRVILVNDKSTDERILPLLRSYQGTGFSLLNAESNSGFSASINKGIAVSKSDVILLNSDTIVTSGWVEKIYACAYSDDGIATVTPLSNSATLCSIPTMCQDNFVPPHVTIDQYGEIVSACSFKNYPQIPVAVGFCMFIKRSVIDEIGGLDAETFGRGYGEENDFCYRAVEYGYHHVMCDDTFIYHKGTVSFMSEEKTALAAKHSQILMERYPEQMKATDDYCRRNPEQYIRDNIQLYMAAQNGKKGLLYLLQADIREDVSGSVGGTQFHVKDLTEGLQADYNIYVMARDGEFLRLTAYIDETMISYKFAIGAQPGYPVFYDGRLGRVFDSVLAAYQIQQVHIHHVMGTSLDLFKAAANRNIPIFASIHDFYYICPTIRLYDHEGEYCYHKDTPDHCQECLRERRGYDSSVVILHKWRRQNELALSQCEKIIFPSHSALAIFKEYFGNLADKFMVIEHGSSAHYEKKPLRIRRAQLSDQVSSCIDFIYSNPLEPNAIVGWASLNGADNSQVEVYLEVKDSRNKTTLIKADKFERPDISQIYESRLYLFTGFRTNVYQSALPAGPVTFRVLLKYQEHFYTDNKFSEAVINGQQLNDKNMNVAFLGTMVPEKGSEVFYEMVEKMDQGINWYIFGALSDDKITRLERNNLFIIGQYKREEINQLLKQYKIDIVCILSQLPETFCYALSEAWSSGIPVIGTDLGAVGERIGREGAGWLIPVTDTADQILALIKKIASSRMLFYEPKKRKITPETVKTTEQMVMTYRTLYQSCERIVDHNRIFDQALMFEGYQTANVVFTKEEQRMMQEIEELKQQLQVCLQDKQDN